MASINNLVLTAHQLGISLEKDIDELERILEVLRKKYRIPVTYSRVSSMILEIPPENDPKEEAWIQEAWL